MKQQSKKRWVDESPRIPSEDYEAYFNANYVRVFDSLKAPYNCPREVALDFILKHKHEYLEEIESTHKLLIPKAVAYMKLKGFMNRKRKQLFDLSSPTLQDSIVKYRYIGFSGGMYSGKTTSANMLRDLLQEHLVSSVVMSFADPMKQMMIRYFGFKPDDLYTVEGKKRMNELWGMTNRKCMQKFGTDALRDNFHPNVWVKVAQLEADKYGCMCIFDDVRFPNEHAFIKDKGLVIRIYNPRVEVNASHPSEMVCEDYDEIIVNDGSLDDLRRKIEAVARKRAIVV
jgi:hypothetical protein